MTDRMRDDQLDRQVRDFLAWQAGELYDAPTATEMAARVGARAGRRPVGLQLAPQLVWVLLAALLIAALIGAAAIGANLLRTVPPAASSYEAVFLRLEVVAGSPIVHVVGVNPEGRVRAIARLDGAWITYGIGLDTGPAYLAPVGAVSPSGLLAIPSSGLDLVMHWEIFDLRRPQAEPVVLAGMGQHVEALRETPYWEFNTRGGVFWGPGERLAILIGQQLNFVDGGTGEVTPVDVPGGLVVLPYWASDGSGVFVAEGDYSNPPEALDRILRPDGTVVDASAALAEASCRMPIGYLFACLAPDDSMIAEILRGSSTSQRGARLIVPGSGAEFEINGSFAGFLEVAP